MSSPTSSGSSTGSSSVERPGVVLGPDGKPCRACNSASSFRKALGSTSSISALAASASTSQSQGNSDECPPDLESLGRSTWTFLHSMAAYLPCATAPSSSVRTPISTSSPQQPCYLARPIQTHLLSLFRSLPHLYPCEHCASHLSEYIKSHPPEKPVLDVGTREEVERWLCETHNEVNKRLGKEVWECGKSGGEVSKRVKERWRDGPADGRCD